MSNIEKITLFKLIHYNTPEDVLKAAKEMFFDFGRGNYSVIEWNEELEKDYPIIGQYLKSKNIRQCWIYFGW